MESLTNFQVIGKSCKPIPVMVLGVLVGRKKYPALKYLFIMMIVAGVALFMYKDSAAQKAGSSDSLIGVGELLLLVSLTCDGLTGAVQERMKAEHGTKSGHMMLAMNKWSIGYLLVALLITGEGVQFISFLQRHPSVLWELASFSVASALGQFFIFMTVSDFGPLPCSIITTTRSLYLLPKVFLLIDFSQEILHCIGFRTLLWKQLGFQTVGWHRFRVCRLLSLNNQCHRHFLMHLLHFRHLLGRVVWKAEETRGGKNLQGLKLNCNCFDLSNILCFLDNDVFRSGLEMTPSPNQNCTPCGLHIYFKVPSRVICGCF